MEILIKDQIKASKRMREYALINYNFELQTRNLKQ